MLRKAKFDKEIKLRAVAFVNQKVLTIHISVYIVADYKVHKFTCTNDKVINIVDRKFKYREYLLLFVF